LSLAFQASRMKLKIVFLLICFSASVQSATVFCPGKLYNSDIECPCPKLDEKDSKVTCPEQICPDPKVEKVKKICPKVEPCWNQVSQESSTTTTTTQKNSDGQQTPNQHDGETFVSLTTVIYITFAEFAVFLIINLSMAYKFHISKVNQRVKNLQNDKNLLTVKLAGMTTPT
jgi:hypothetical protein